MAVYNTNVRDRGHFTKEIVFHGNEEALIVEISNSFLSEVYDPCVGFWNDALNWREVRR